MQSQINDAQITPAPFGASWSISGTRALLDLDTSRPTNQSELSAWYRDHYWPAQETLGLAIAGSLLHLKQSGELSVAPHSEYVSTRWNRSWTHFVQDTGYVEIDEIVRDLAILTFHDLQLNALPGNASSETIHQDIVDFIERGTFAWFDMKSGVYSRSGETLYPAFENWRPTLGTVDHINRGEFAPLVAEQIDMPRVEHLVVDFPTGELIINDWICIPEFAQVIEDVEVAISQRRDSINHNAFIEESSAVITAKVPPGQYHLYFAGDGNTFAHTFESPDADLSIFETAMFTLSPKPLRLTPSEPEPLRASRPAHAP